VKQKGITLLEILVVVVLLMALTLVSSFAIGNKVAKARDSRRKTDLNRIKIALYDYYFDADCFPMDLPECNQAFNLNGQQYMPSFPCDLLGEKYTYVREETDCPGWFRVFTNLENVEDASIEAVGCQWGCGLECEFNYGVVSTNTKLNEDCVTYYACTPSGDCESFFDPVKSGCPKVFENDEECGGISCSKDKDAKCHDMSGKFHE
jgi:type II secretory pathway pseudopilin PulG